jgi:hypothetical protein
MAKLIFHNRETRPLNIAVETDAESVPRIMAWYGAWAAGDKYAVTFAGRNVPIDQNGEPLNPIEEP